MSYHFADKRLLHKRQRILASDRGSVNGSTLGRGSTFDSMGRWRWRIRGDTSTLMVGRRERGREGGRKRGGSRSDREESEVRGGRNEESSEKNVCGNATAYITILSHFSPLSLLSTPFTSPPLFLP